MTFSQLFGGNLLTKDGCRPTNEVLQGKKAIGIYFSASWCPPCHFFTPVLAKAYKELKESGENGFEIVFVSSDQDAAAFDEYYTDMPWTTIPYDQLRGVKDELDQKYDVDGIPTLVVIDSEGATLTEDGRDLIMQYGSKAFPFTEEHMKLLKEEAKKECEQALKTLATEDLQSVLGLESGFQVVCLVFGSAEGSVEMFSDCLPQLSATDFAARYIPWSERANTEGHEKAAKDIPQLPLSPSLENLLLKVVPDIQPPHFVTLGRKEDGEWEVLALDAYDAIQQFGARAYPWSKARVAELQAEEDVKAAALTQKLKGMEFLGTEDVTARSGRRKDGSRDRDDSCRD